MQCLSVCSTMSESGRVAMHSDARGHLGRNTRYLSFAWVDRDTCRALVTCADP